MITVQELAAVGCTKTGQSCPNWMYNYLKESMSYGGTVSDTNTANGVSYSTGYWIMSAHFDISNST